MDLSKSGSVQLNFASALLAARDLYRYAVRFGKVECRGQAIRGRRTELPFDSNKTARSCFGQMLIA
jgi:hypothetical protein